MPPPRGQGRTSRRWGLTCIPNRSVRCGCSGHSAPVGDVLRSVESVERHHVGTEQVASRHDPHQPTVDFEQDVADVFLHHPLRDLTHGRRGVAPHELRAGDIAGGRGQGSSASEMARTTSRSETTPSTSSTEPRTTRPIWSPASSSATDRRVASAAMVMTTSAANTPPAPYHQTLGWCRVHRSYRQHRCQRPTDERPSAHLRRQTTQPERHGLCTARSPVHHGVYSDRSPEEGPARRKGPSPVARSPPRAHAEGVNEKQPRRRIVVGVDGSPASLRALHWAAAEAARRQTGLDVVHAWMTPYPLDADRRVQGSRPVRSAGLGDHQPRHRVTGPA